MSDVMWFVLSILIGVAGGFAGGQDFRRAGLCGGAADDVTHVEGGTWVVNHEEAVEIYGRVFTFRYVERPDLRRVEVAVLEGSGEGARPLVPHPVRGRDAADARERAMTALHNYAGLDRYLRLVRRVAQDLAPGSRLEVDEDAGQIRVELVGPRRLRSPLTLVREDALDPERSDDELLAFIRAHFEGYLEETSA